MIKAEYFFIWVFITLVCFFPVKVEAESGVQLNLEKETQEKGQELFSGVRELFQGGDREKAQAAMQEIREKMTNMQKETEKSIVTKIPPK